MLDLCLTVVLGAAVLWLTVRGIPTQTKWERRIAYIVGAFALFLIVVQGYRSQAVMQEIRNGIATLTGKATKAEVRLYCGQKDITNNGEIETLWIPSNSVAIPSVWIVNVGPGDAINVEGHSDVKEDLSQLPITGDKDWPHSVPWQFPLLRPNDPKIISGPASYTPVPLTGLSVKMVASYNGPAINTKLIVKFVPSPGPNYPPNYLPCPRPRPS